MSYYVISKMKGSNNMCNCGCNRGRGPERPGSGCGNRPSRPSCGCGNRPSRPGGGVGPGSGSRPNPCRRDDVGGARCPFRTPRAWQDPRYGSPGR